MSSPEVSASASNKRQRMASPSEINQAHNFASNQAPIASGEAPAFTSGQENVSDQAPTVASDQATSIAASSQGNASSISASQATHYCVLALAEFLKLNEELRQARAREDVLTAAKIELQKFLDESMKQVETLLTEADKQSEQIAELRRIVKEYEAMHQ